MVTSKTQITERKHLKSIEKKLKRSSERIPSTKEFEEFINLISEYYGDYFSITKYQKNVEIDTYCENVKITKRFITDSFTIKTDKLFVVFTPYRNGIYLHLIKVFPLYRGMGIGNGVMKSIREVSNSLDLPVYLVPVPLNGEGVGYSTLQKFYSNHGYSRESDSRYWKYEPNSISDTQNQEYKMVS